MKESIHDFIHFLLVLILSWSKRQQLSDYAAEHSHRYRNYRSKRRNERKVNIKLK
jgi:hypothetical protein